MKNNNTSLQLWFAPALIGLISLGGLVNALVFDGWGDTLSWILLGIPLAIICFFIQKAR